MSEAGEQPGRSGTDDARLTARLATAGGASEATFGVRDVAVKDGRVRATMPAAALRVGAAGETALGGLGVLADDVGGFAIIAAHERHSWSVSVEIGIDLVAPLPTTGLVHAVGEGYQVSDERGYATCALSDDSGRVLAFAHQHGRYVADPVPSDEPAAASGTPVAFGTSEPSGRMAELVAAGGNPLAQLLDLELGAPEEPVGFPKPRNWLNPVRIMHGGISLAISEAVALRAAGGAPGWQTTSLTIGFMRPVPPRHAVTYRPTFVHRGRTLQVIEVAGTSDGVLRTHARVTCQALG